MPSHPCQTAEPLLPTILSLRSPYAIHISPPLCTLLRTRLIKTHARSQTHTKRGIIPARIRDQIDMGPLKPHRFTHLAYPQAEITGAFISFLTILSTVDNVLFYELIPDATRNHRSGQRPSTNSQSSCWPRCRNTDCRRCLIQLRLHCGEKEHLLNIYIAGQR